MKVKHAIKKIVALAGGAAMVGATVMGALAATDLTQWKDIFIQDGQWTGGHIVLGANAKTIDTISSNDLISYLQTQAVTKVPVESEDSIVVENGVLIEGPGSKLNLNDTLDNPKSSLKEEDLPELLADGTVRDSHYEDKDYDYTQKIYLGDAQVKYGKPESDWEKPQLYIDLKNANYLYTYEVKFNEPLYITKDDNIAHRGLVDGEKIKLLGKEYTFSSSTTNDGDLVLYGSQQVVVVNQGESKEVTMDGKTYTIEVKGGNSDKQTAWISVNGESETVSEGEDTEIGGLQLHIDDIFITNVGGESVAVKFFIGSQKLEIPHDALSDWSEVKVNGETVDGVEVRVTNSSEAWTGVDKIEFRVDPSSFKDDIDYLKIGEEVVDPIFGTKVKFAAVHPELADDNKVYVEMGRSGNDFSIKFTNEDGYTVEFEPYTYEENDLKYGPDFGVFASHTNIPKNSLFILNEGSGSKITKIYEVRSVTSDGVTLRELTRDKEIENLKIGDEIEDTGVTITAVDADNDIIQLDTATSNEIYTKDGMKIVLGAVNTTTDTALINITEDAWNRISDETISVQFSVQLTYDDNDNRLELSNLTGVHPISDDDNNIDYFLTELGTYGQLDLDNDGEYLKVWYPTDKQGEMYFDVYFGSENAVEQQTSGDYREVVNPLPSGVAILDTDYTSGPAIVIGGPCVNTIAAQLMGNPENCAEGFEPGYGLIKLFPEKDTLLIAGYSGEDTAAAVHVLTNYENYLDDLQGKTEVKVITSTQSITDFEEQEEENTTEE